MTTYTPRNLHPLIAELRRLRLAHIITTQSIAHRIGTSPTTFCRWERGVVQPRFAYLLAWANALELDLTLCPLTKPSTKRPSLSETSPILHSYRALRSNTPGIVRR